MSLDDERVEKASDLRVAQMQHAIAHQNNPTPADGGWHRGDWMQTFTGRRFYPLDPKPEDIDVLDIGHALGMICRYGGHIDRFYSVAEHCVLMSFCMPTPQLALEALLHDASEAYLGDMVRPLKHSGAMAPYLEVERALELVIAQRFGLPIVKFSDKTAAFYKMPEEVKDADTRILLTERTALMKNYKPSDRWAQDGMEPLPVAIQAWDHVEASNRWLARFAELTSKPAGVK